MPIEQCIYEYDAVLRVTRVPPTRCANRMSWQYRDSWTEVPTALRRSGVAVLTWRHSVFVCTASSERLVDSGKFFDILLGTRSTSKQRWRGSSWLVPTCGTARRKDTYTVVGAEADDKYLTYPPTDWVSRRSHRPPPNKKKVLIWASWQQPFDKVPAQPSSPVAQQQKKKKKIGTAQLKVHNRPKSSLVTARPSRRLWLLTFPLPAHCILHPSNPAKRHQERKAKAANRLEVQKRKGIQKFVFSCVWFLS